MVGQNEVPTAKTDRKRAQNRLAQKLFREKQASYIQHLERSLELASASPHPPSIASGPACYDSVVTQLTKDNLELREALLRFRKFLLRFGESASSYAGELAFTHLCVESWVNLSCTGTNVYFR